MPSEIGVLSVVPLAGTWIETLLYAIYSTSFPSFPLRERGLKPEQMQESGGQIPVVPLAGTWIETLLGMTQEEYDKGRSPCGNVD